MTLVRPLALALRVCLTALLFAACGFLTDVDPVTVSLRTVVFATQEEFEQWPSSPTIEGGESLIVRGRAFVGCGRPEAEAQRHYNVVGVEIRAVETDGFCLGIVPAWVPVEATVSGLAPGTYRVRVAVVGHTERAEATATVAAP